jgi:hypothetical protein
MKEVTIKELRDDVCGMYILDGKKIVKENDILKWGKWFQRGNRHVGKTVVGNLEVSTIFVGIHQYGGIFETMIFVDKGGGLALDYQERYWTWDAAERGHTRIVELLEALP